jgi:hypothetical protein
MLNMITLVNLEGNFKTMAISPDHSDLCDWDEHRYPYSQSRQTVITAVNMGGPILALYLTLVKKSIFGTILYPSEDLPLPPALDPYTTGPFNDMRELMIDLSDSYYEKWTIGNVAATFDSSLYIVVYNSIIELHVPSLDNPFIWDKLSKKRIWP